MSLEGPIQVEFPQGDPLVREFPEGQLLQPLQQFHGFGSGVRFDISSHHVYPCVFGPMGGLKHGVGFPHAGSIAKKDFQFALARGFPLNFLP